MLNRLLPGHRDRREIRTALIWAIAPLALVFAIAVLVVRHHHKPVLKLVGDPAASSRANPLLGFFSNVGVIGWCGGATVALFCCWLMWRWRMPREVVRFHFSVGAFTTLLMADDFFLIHDHLAPRYLGVPELAVYLVYAVLFGALVSVFRREILARNPGLLALALGFLGIVAGTDILSFAHGRIVALGMAGSKLLGIYTWATWLIVAARRDLETARVAAPASPSKAALRR